MTGTPVPAVSASALAHVHGPELPHGLHRVPRHQPHHVERHFHDQERHGHDRHELRVGQRGHRTQLSQSDDR